MNSRKSRPYECSVVREVVHIRLKSRLEDGVFGRAQRFVQCDQAECQYVDANKPPCPLTLALFATDNHEADPGGIESLSAAIPPEMRKGGSGDPPFSM